MVSTNNFLADIFSFIKTNLSSITDPIASSRSSSSKFILTSYPQVNVIYPIITIKMNNKKSSRAGMQTTAMNVELTIEVRVWARNEKEKDDLYNQVYEKLRNAQFTSSTGSVANDLHDFNELSAVEVDEEGEAGIKSRIGTFKYSFYNVS
jgi:hypothetical protein